MTIATYFPEKATRENYLFLLQNPDVVPFTEKEAKLFELSKHTTAWADFCIGYQGYCIGIIIPVTVSLISFKVFGPIDDIAVIIAGLAVVAFSNIWSMHATGNAPARASDMQNKEQNTLLRIRENYENIADYMLLQCAAGKKKEMIECAKKIDTDRIRGILSDSTTQKESVEFIVSYLKAVVQYIRTVDGIRDTSSNSELEKTLIDLHLPIPEDSLI